MNFILTRDLYVPAIDAWIDPGTPKKRAIITHGHADHARSGHGAVLATPETIAIMKTRYGEDCAGRFEALRFGEALRIGEALVSLHPAGHILGSAQVRIEGEGQRALVTGDYKRLPDRTAEAYEPVECDLLVTEATFGLPVFQHPKPQDEIARLLKSVADQPERCHLVGCYALGKAQGGGAARSYRAGAAVGAQRSLVAPVARSDHGDGLGLDAGAPTRPAAQCRAAAGDFRP